MRFEERREWYNRNMYLDLLAERGRFEISVAWQLAQRTMPSVSSTSSNAVSEHTHCSLFIELMEGSRRTLRLVVQWRTKGGSG